MFKLSQNGIFTTTLLIERFDFDIEQVFSSSLCPATYFSWTLDVRAAAVMDRSCGSYSQQQNYSSAWDNTCNFLLCDLQTSTRQTEKIKTEIATRRHINVCPSPSSEQHKRDE